MPISYKSTAYLPKQIRRALIRIIQKMAGADLALPIRAVRAIRKPLTAGLSRTKKGTQARACVPQILLGYVC